MVHSVKEFINNYTFNSISTQLSLNKFKINNKNNKILDTQGLI